MVRENGWECQDSKKQITRRLILESKKSLQSERYLEKLESMGGILLMIMLNDDINLSSSIIESFSFVSNKHCDVIGGRIYITHCCFIMIQKILCRE
jgi:hypothetical protein